MPKKKSKGKRSREEDELEGLRDALACVAVKISWDKSLGEAENVDEVKLGLDMLSSALAKRVGRRWGDAPPLDEVLAELGYEDELVESAAELIDALGRVAYDSGLSEDDVKEAEISRARLVEHLENVLLK